MVQIYSHFISFSTDESFSDLIETVEYKLNNHNIDNSTSYTMKDIKMVYDEDYSCETVDARMLIFTIKG